mmetsp:Transcript_35278/g.81704  ORF Transcript_35278/g.81704 Transcript_35278/m.81704 type:complete len:566 (-) Transcript_35278:331-2028(-)|eukprot:CAMPEP_0113311854 /NCGR_PEP_ID=MMETSP0010_2-20120614/8914_1 /TAXON_ID=216773 ORGANISM="Corethron hystrix, Strain 308" /NCGR_SAMPLE_ID=MMETSP0010_2 /ASSEMBLY_ACC=CAM_ASM_000155 /LENGTH=565 /DNA_ID=CAMNT_0000167555 /DNA_START=198 /DNA_END=1895 /DNA_ORIENTATION=- /assembly_acc=CAM_ASM_000155
MGFLLKSRRNAALAVFLSLSASYGAAFVPSASVGAFVGPSVPNRAFGVVPRAASPSSTSLRMNLVRKENSAVEITITAPAKATQAAYDRACADVSKNVDIPGFRKGSKIPPRVLENQLESKGAGGKYAIKAQAIEALLSTMVEPALQKEGVEPIGQPALSVPATELAVTFVPGEDLNMVVNCDVWPTLAWKNDDEVPWKGLEGSYKRKPFNQARLDKSFEDLRERYAILSPMDEGSATLAMGDAAVVNMVGYMAAEDGVTKAEPLPAAASGDDVEVILGEGRYMEGLVEGLVGAKVGEERTVGVNFPERLKDKTLAGKRAIFDVKVLQANTRTLPTLDDAFAGEVRPGMTLADLTAELTKAINDDEASEYTDARNAALSNALAARIDVECPDTVLTQQAREKYTMTMTEMRDNGTADAEIKKLITPENFLKFKEIYKEGIEKDFAVSMAIEVIAKTEEVVPDPVDVDQQMDNLKKEVEKQGEEWNPDAYRPRIESTMQRGMVFDLLAEHSNLEVEYEDEAVTAQLNEELLDKLAKESLEREGVENPEAVMAAAKAKEAEDSEQVN